MSDSDIKRLLMRSSNAFSGLDSIQTWLVKKRQSELITVIRNIVNISLKPRVLPPCTKGALLKPLTKKPNLDWSNVSNYRAVSNLSFPSKITERPVPSHLSKCFLVNKLNETQRSTFKCAHSTETALFRVKNDIMVSFDHSQAAVVLFFVVCLFFICLLLFTELITVFFFLNGRNCFGLSGMLLSGVLFSARLYPLEGKFPPVFCILRGI